jgi:hypothetical protein
MKYVLRMNDECGGTEKFAIEANCLSDAEESAGQEATWWAEDGAWGDNGAVINVCWTLTQDGEEVASGTERVQIEPNHRNLICDAGGDPDCDHDWTAEGEGGCRENPGVWSGGGTTIVFNTHCRHCGLHRVQTNLGCQRNEGECDTVEYAQPESWCSECEREDCKCERDECA